MAATLPGLTQALGDFHMQQAVKFPVYVTFGDGSTNTFDDIADLECNLEHFDSQRSPECLVVDSQGRRLVLRIELLELKELRLEHQ